MDEIVAQVKALAASSDDADRIKIQSGLRNLQRSLETPFETMMRLSGPQIELAVMRVGVDLDLFNLLSISQKPWTVDQLAEKVGAAPQLLGRILRYLASVSLIDETDIDTFSANASTKMLAQSAWAGSIHHGFNVVGETIQSLPKFLQETKYQNITTNTHTPFQLAFNTPLSAFEWYPQHPEAFAHFQASMTVERPGSWLDVFPFQEEIEGWKGGNEERVLMVDVGGGFGQQSVGLRKKYPGLKGRVVLQDLPATIGRLGGGLEGVEVMAHNFLEVQPVKGAKFYYFRAVMHDYPDEKCVDILKNIMSAMDKDSKILVDDMVLPNKGVQWEACGIDFMMMSCLGALERTNAQWVKLIESAGLKIEKVHLYSALLNHSVITVGLRD